jgi:hypothetical protein
MKNKINKEGRLSMNATPTRPSNTGPPTKCQEEPKIKTGTEPKAKREKVIT